MKKFFFGIIVPALVFVLSTVGAATVVIATAQSCSGKSTTSTCIQDMTQEDVDTLVEDNENLNNKLNAAICELNAYRDYYSAVEHLLDEVGVDTDSPALETDAGADYLNRKWVVDSLENENKWAQPIKK